MPPASATPPDGGYGYLVMLTSWVGQFLVGTMYIGFSTLMVELVDHFQTSHTTVALTGAVFVGSLNFCGILTGGLVHLFGCRRLCIIGALMTATAGVATSFATNIYMTYFTYGILGGVGASMLVLPSIVILQQYFDHKRALTTGIASTGMSFGGLVVGPAYRLLIDAFGWRATLMALAGLQLQGAVIGATFRPLNGSSSPEGSGTPPRQSKTLCSGLFELFRNKLYMLYLIGGSLWQYGVTTMYVLSPSRGVSQGMDKLSASLLPSSLALCAVVGRLVCSFIGHLDCVNVIVQSAILSTLSGVVICLSCTTASFYGSAIFIGTFGFCFGGIMALSPTVIATLVGVENSPQALGMIMVFMGITGLTAIPVGGWIYDQTNNYNISFMIGGIVTIVGGFLLWTVVILNRRDKRNGNRSAGVEEVEAVGNLSSGPERESCV